MALCHSRTLSILLVLLLLVTICSVVQAQPKRPLTIPVKPSNPQQSAAVQPLPARAEIRRDLHLVLKASNLSERLEHDLGFAQLQASKQFEDIALAFSRLSG